MNLHPSLLPQWRGPSPIQSTILAGDNTTGVTLFLMVDKMDEGPILANSKFQIPNSKFTTEKLSNELANLGAQLIIETLPEWIHGEIKPVPQDYSKATYSKTFTKEDGRIDWTESAQDIERQIRAFQQWPGSFTTFAPENKKSALLKIVEAGDPLPHTKPLDVFGKVVTLDDVVAVQTGSGLLSLRVVQLEGKKPMGMKEFINGHPQFIGTLLR